MKLLLLSVLVLSCSCLFGQNTLGLLIQETSSLEPVVYASVVLNDQTIEYTDARGRVSLVIPDTLSDDAELRISVSHIAYRDTSFTVLVSEQMGRLINVNLVADATLPTIDVRARTIQNGYSTSQLTPSIEKLRKAPALLGETDYLKALTLLPGISTGLEGTANIQIRGGNPSQTHLILDGITLYNVGHLGGFLSSLDPFSVKGITVYKGGVPSRFGGRLSGVLDVELLRGRRDSSRSEISIGTATVRYGIQGPLGGDGSIVASGRFSYPSALVNLSQASSFERNEQGDKTNVAIGDAVVKGFWDFGNQDLSALVYLSGDDGIVQSSSDGGQRITLTDDYNWGTSALALTYRRYFSYATTLKLNSTFSNYNYGYTFTRSSGESNDRQREITEQDSGIRDITWSADLKHRLSNQFFLTAGVQAIRHRFVTSIDLTRENVLTTLVEEQRTLIEAATYVGGELEAFNGRLTLRGGARISGSNSTGSILRPEPRVSASLRVLPNVYFNAGYDRQTQYLHQLTTDLALLPNAIWIPADEQFTRSSSDQIYSGFAGRLEKLGVDWSLEVFHKELSDLVTLKNRSLDIFAIPERWRESIAGGGNGRVQGLEVFLNKTSGKFDFWVAYTLSNSSRRYAEINDGEWFPYTFDRTHDASITCNLALSNGWSLSSALLAQTGQAVTLPVAATSNFFVYEGVNNARVPAYHRLDLVLRKTYRGRKNPARLNTLTFSLYNAYNRANPIDFRLVPNTFPGFTTDPDTGQPVLLNANVVEQFALFPIVPGVAYSVSF